MKTAWNVILSLVAALALLLGADSYRVAGANFETGLKGEIEDSLEESSRLVRALSNAAQMHEAPVPAMALTGAASAESCLQEARYTVLDLNGSPICYVGQPIDGTFVTALTYEVTDSAGSYDLRVSAPMTIGDTPMTVLQTRDVTWVFQRRDQDLHQYRYALLLALSVTLWAGAVWIRAKSRAKGGNP